MNASPLPVKQIHTQHDLANFQKSLSHNVIKTHLIQIVQLVQGIPSPPGSLDPKVVRMTVAQNTNARVLNLPPPSKTVESLLPMPYQAGSQAIIGILQSLRNWVREIPPVQVKSRFGNPSCKIWHAKLNAEISEMLCQHLRLLYTSSARLPTFEQLMVELVYYFVNSFGSSVRLDYGTGHELSFLSFLVGLFKYDIIHFVPLTASQALNDHHLMADELLAMFGAYYDLARDLIVAYTLEPAGSHGVWGLDDHFHLIYILGASQLLTETSPLLLRPSQFLKPATLESHYVELNLFVNAISFIKRVKTGPFNEHSPLLYNLTSVISWSKILKGLLRMYDVDVLGKFPVVQHFYFGTYLFPWCDMLGRPFKETSELEETVTDGVNTPPTFPSTRVAGVTTIPSTRAPGSGVPVTKVPWSGKTPTSHPGVFPGTRRGPVPAANLYRGNGF
ncbi:hypothetical protein BABINDRAFT_42025 [Babjeviella inositovora NRRL Y-12698]|uniref:Serine/threonine-protein phosphatase 2A activator n=1 Tax=Babjeviella inositovora NRRL Y-12698 TaxID=984486 RepID=A0A1E3QHW9_9ASCO|nr:uncharacterized protein BABINDRAFT_42025 [Babjeviella inositovora NRRL Y-12698]ODQ77198.1 hypothetical protein BABINDRAFT_42025 [Babjeviella inositovora NRRL Y-12698]